MNNINCNCYFDSSFAYVINNINDEPINKINIIDYLSNELLQTDIIEKKKILVCKNKNELIKYKSENIKSHFKHKNYNGMTEWHKTWQNKFDTIEFQIDNRRADAIINDYIKNNKILYWIIDCNESINIYEKGDIYLITFIKDKWKYQHFIQNNFIFLNIDNRLFKINPSQVKSDMIDVREYKEDIEFINSLKNNINIWNENEIIDDCVLHYRYIYYFIKKIK
jgi:hypothetical protein